MNKTNEEIWNIIKPLMTTKEDEYDDDYKQQLINGYKICYNKTYDFKTFEEEDEYLMEASADEEVYYYEFIWQKHWDAKSISIDDFNNKINKNKFN